MSKKETLGVKDRQPKVTILMADDDDDDSLLVHDALLESRLPIKLHIVKDGEELMDYLSHRGLYTDVNKAPRPGLIFLDLNMPKKHGLEVLKELKNHPQHRIIPVIVMTSSNTEEDIYNTYNLGANSFIQKPGNFTSLVEVMKTIGKYWFEIVELPL
ncbi:response regulator receiver protein [Sphaerospermopsis reniformis]|jgi:CheY-like chemotaxis protein|uniref:Response regulator receiver protein n=1 Tax=Sphaerospermopsis reniformis TaxID=531300 RepID=A0A480A008_9CYAN|nr:MULTISPECIES: response regulator [unclassified Sphaerospermopsis]GCL38320.1 response regulator receiver protein [Sphaerospermopsis reniformis]